MPLAQVNITVPNADLTKINQETVMLRVGDTGDPACPQYVAPVQASLLGGLFQKKWNPFGTTAQARFDQLALALWHHNSCPRNGTFPITVSGLSTDGQWSFSATGTLAIISTLSL